MKTMLRGKHPMLVAIVLMLAGTAAPTLAQDTMGEARLRKLEAEVRAIQRQVFPGDGRVFTPQVTPQAAAPAAGAPASTPVTDLLTRMEAVEAQMARLTAQAEENANRLRLLEARLPAPPEAAAVAADGTTLPAAPAVAAATSPTAAPAPAAAPAAVAPAPRPVAATVATPTPTVRPNPPSATARPAAPSAARIAAVRAIVKPQTADAGDDEYSYGYRLWEAKFYPEAQQQLRLFLDKYPRHSRVSFARNLLGRAYLDDGKPRDAATWFLQNYNADKAGPRAADSLLFLAESMARLKDTSRACIALGEFADSYSREATGRLKAQYDATRASVKCN